MITIRIQCIFKMPEFCYSWYEAFFVLRHGDYLQYNHIAVRDDNGIIMIDLW